MPCTSIELTNLSWNPLSATVNSGPEWVFRLVFRDGSWVFEVNLDYLRFFAVNPTCKFTLAAREILPRSTGNVRIRWNKTNGGVYGLKAIVDVNVLRVPLGDELSLRVLLGELGVTEKGFASAVYRDVLERYNSL